MIENCPVCKIPLDPKTYDNAAFQECSQCAGVWILQSALGELEEENVQDLDQIDDSEVPIKQAADPSEMDCPCCGKDMLKYHFMYDTPIQLYRCDDCNGLWIEHGELKQMAAAIEAAKEPPTAEEIALASGLPVPSKDATQPIPSDPSVEARKEEILAEFTAEHEKTMAHYAAMTAMCRAMSAHVRGYGWYGGFGRI
jgi:Zn-finger nucleic acid-binding protein